MLHSLSLKIELLVAIYIEIMCFEEIKINLVFKDKVTFIGLPPGVKQWMAIFTNKHALDRDPRELRRLQLRTYFCLSILTLFLSLFQTHSLFLSPSFLLSLSLFLTLSPSFSFLLTLSLSFFHFLSLPYSLSLFLSLIHSLAFSLNTYPSFCFCFMFFCSTFVFVFVYRRRLSIWLLEWLSLVFLSLLT